MLQDVDQAKVKHPPTDRTAGNADELQCRTYLSGMIDMLITEIAHTRHHGILTVKHTHVLKDYRGCKARAGNRALQQHLSIAIVEPCTPTALIANTLSR